MAEKVKNHFIPNFIINNFSFVEKNEGKDVWRISFLMKPCNLIQKNILSKTQCQKRYFYSKKHISVLLKEFKHIKLNPIFNNINNTLEENLDIYLENKFARIYSNFKMTNNVIELNLENEFIKEYFVIQYLRAEKFKDFLKNNPFHPNINYEQTLKENILKTTKMPSSKVKKLLKTNKYKKLLSKHAKNCKVNVNKYADAEDRHTLEILSAKNRESIFMDYELKKKNMTILLNKTDTPFVLSDWGILIMKSKNSENKNDYEFFLSISPTTSILFSKNINLVEKISEDYVNSINQMLFDESKKIIYSSDITYLKSFKKSRSF